MEALNQINRFAPDDNILDSSLEATVQYNAGLIEQKIQNIGVFNCKECEKVLSINEKVTNDCIKSAKMNTPCTSTVFICRVAQKYMKEFEDSILYFNYHLVNARIIEDIETEDMFQKSFMDCPLSHKSHFIQFIVNEYIRMTATYMAKTITLKQQSKFHRKKLRKIIHFQGQ